VETSARHQPERQCCSRHGTGLLRSYSSSSVSNFLVRHNNEELPTYHPPALIVAIIALTDIHRKRRYAHYQRVQDYDVEQMKCVLLLFPVLFSRNCFWGNAHQRCSYRRSILALHAAASEKYAEKVDPMASKEEKE